MEVRNHSFIKGMNRDVSKDKFPNDAYYYLLNGRVLADDNATLSDIINIKGNTEANINNNGLVRTAYSIIGYATIQNDIVLFYSTNGQTTDSLTSYSVIDILEYQGDNLYSRREAWLGQGLNFRIDKKIRAVARYESDIVQKIYWVDDNNPLKQANIAEDISSYDANQFDINGDMLKSKAPIFSDYTSGSLKPGSICYAYRLVKKNGYKTVFSDVSQLVPIGSNIQKWQIIRNMYGDDIYDPDAAYNTGKGTVFSVDIGDSDYLDYYDFIEVVSLWYSSDSAIPDINIISKVELTSSLAYRVIDTGTNSYGTLTYAEFLDQSNTFVVKDIATKDNRLFAANIHEEYFNLDEDSTWSGKSPGDIWDARAYRFDNGGTPRAELLSSAISAPEYTLLGPSPNYTSVAENANAINVYNNVTALESGEENTVSLKQKYQVSGSAIGGSGINISYTFTSISNYYASTPDDSPSLDGSVRESDYEAQLGITRGFQREEVYRFGIVFFDKKGRQSFVKWVGDIRMPSMADSSDVGSYNFTTDEITTNTVHPQFSISNIPTISGESLDWQIVYVKREEADKGVVAAGLTLPVLRDYADASIMRASSKPYTITEYASNAGTGLGDLNKNLVNFISPEVSYRKTESLNFEFLQITGDLSTSACVWKDRAVDPNVWTALPACNDQITTTDHYAYNRKFISCIDGTAKGRVTVSDFVKTIPPTSFYFTTNVGGVSYRHFGYHDAGGSNSAAPAGTCFTCYISTTLPTSSSTGYYYAYARKVVYQSQYGGLDYSVKQANVFIPASPKMTGIETSTVCEYGDMYSGVLEHNRFSMIYPDAAHTSFVAKSFTDFSYILCETSIPLLLNTGDTFSRVFTIDADDPLYIGDEPWVNIDTGLSFTSIYEYNSAYNKVEDSRKFFPQPFLFEAIEEQNTRVKYSDVKLENEDIDSWLSFRTNNFNDANENYGEINRLEEFRDKIFSFQNNAVSLISINPRVTQQSQDGVSIILGTGSVIDKFHYLTTDIGCQDNSDVIKSFFGLYWLDKNKKKVYSFNENIESVTDLKGMHSYLKNNIYENSVFTGSYDVNNSEVLMTITDDSPNTIFEAIDIGGGYWTLSGMVSVIEIPFVVGRTYSIENGYFTYVSKTDTSYTFLYSHGTNLIASQDVDLSDYITERDNFTLAYNEKLQAFTSFYSFLPDLYIYHNRDFFTSQNSRDLWQHNIGDDYNTYYGTTYPTTLKIISNFGSQMQSEYTNVRFFAEVENAEGEIQANETMSNIMLKDATQLSEDIILYPIHLPNDVDTSRYVLDTSGLRIGTDWYTGLTSNTEDLVVYNNELYRALTDAQAGPPVVGVNWAKAELCNIRKTINYWATQMPRFLFDENGLSDPEYLLSNRFRSNWLELTFEFKDMMPGVNLSDRRLKLSDLKLVSDPLLF